MCCFSVTAPAGLIQRLFAPKLHVSQTNIFARFTAPGVQVLAYAMNLDTAQEVAMILPLPIRPNAGEDAVRFIDLQAHPRMFEELAQLFEAIEPAPRGRAMLALHGSAPALVVHDVGSFIASYVPTRFDFDRLDRRFQLPRVLFDAVPHYKDYSFAVVQLKPGKQTLHPMAFTFPSRELEKLYIPTVHLHDGRFHRTAKFDHALYYQHPRVLGQGGAFEGDEVAPSVPWKDYAAVVDRQKPVLRRTLRGKLPNHDTWIATGRPITVRTV
jgi:hypothetical protein